LIVHRGDWLLPIAGPPVRDGWVAVDRGVIVATGGPGAAPPADAQDDGAAGPRVILPGLVNAHTHLELSWMAGQVPPAPSMPAWAERLIGLRASAGGDAAEPIRAAVEQCRAAGTALVGDITNTLAAYGVLLDSPLSACVFREVIGFGGADPGLAVGAVREELARLPPSARLKPSIVPHAPYSVSPALLTAIAREAPGSPVAVHLAESVEELEFLASGTGAWRSLLERLGAWNAQWQVPRCGPVEYLARCGLLTGRLVAVHGVQLTGDEVRRLAGAGATIVACPRSNRWTGAGDPPIGRFYESGVRVAIGTDSLASVPDLNLFQELRALRALAPEVPARRLLESATRSGAEALGFASELGTIEPGKRAELIAVRLPPEAADVEEYLVGGIGPAAIRWLDGGI
jgi:cytosine/adenosine deaminase-related metal-dependent hydrolase